MIAAALDRLADAFEARGIRVRENLRPGATEPEIDAVEQALGVRLPESYRELYRWSAGCIDHEAGPQLVFRDMCFLPLDRIVETQRELVAVYLGQDDADRASADEFGVDLRATAPIAEYMGSYLTVACGRQSLSTVSDHPVIGVFQGLDVYFHSIETMLDTCIEWVEQAGYEEFGTAPNEREIWLRHNPGLFA